MSLINDVLRELDQRQATSASSDTTAGTAGLPPAPRRSWWPWLVAAVITGVSIQLLDSYWDQQAGLDNTRPDAVVRSAAAETSAGSTPQQPLLASLNAPSDASRTPAIPALARAPLSVGQAQASAKHSTADDTLDTATTRPAQEPAQEPKPGPTPAATIVEAPQADAPAQPAHIRIERSAGSSDDNAVEQALRAVGRDQYALAEQRLQTHLADHPDDVRARLLLAEVLLGRQRPSAARIVLEQGLDPASAKEIGPALARLLADADNPAEARRILLKHPPGLTQAPDYHLLLAALHRQLGAHRDAAELYQALVENDPGNATAWVGLGASLETLDRMTEARAAYAAALAHGDARLTRFANQRLAAIAAAGDNP